MRQEISIAEAKARFSEWVRRAETGDVLVLRRHGKAVAALVPPEDVALLERLRAAGPEKGLASVAGGWEGSDELARALDRQRRTRPRAARRLG